MHPETAAELEDPGEAAVAVRHLNKRYGGAVALRDVSLNIQRAHIHAIVGENGAGKSTLGKILAGVTTPDTGEVFMRGESVQFRSPRDALDCGVALVHQEIALVPTLSVLENVFLGAEPKRAGVVRRKPLRARLAALNEQTGFGLPADAAVSTLPLADQQKVEILRALARDARVIIFDEPTAPLSSNESEALYGILRRLKERDTTIVYVSHFLEEVLALADTVSVLKDGQHVETKPAAAATVESLIFSMLGRSLEATFPPKRPCRADAPIALEVSDLGRRGAVSRSSLTVRRGEIVGLAGLVGSGRTELARLIYGADRSDEGTVWVGGDEVRIRSPRDAIENGMAMIPESRKDQGLVMTQSVRENATLPSLGAVTRAGILSSRRERRLAGSIIEKVGLRPPEPERSVATLSGGNQQKVVFGRWMHQDLTLLIADEPTRGVDVGAKHALHKLLLEQAERGVGVLLISSDLEEIMGLSHRIYVMNKGRLVAELGGDAEEDQILAAAFETREELTV
jgi:ABC-type sugar transport system ATPase subunit